MFQVSGDESGVSVIDRDCVAKDGLSVCEHIRTYYPVSPGSLVLLWIFSEDTLPKGYRLVQDDSNGDKCHFNITGLSNGRTKNFFKLTHVSSGEHVYCKNGEPAVVSLPEMGEIIRTHSLD